MKTRPHERDYNAALAERVTAYWKGRGYDVSCQVIQCMRFDGDGNSLNNPTTGAVHGVRSDMVNGLPTQCQCIIPRPRKSGPEVQMVRIGGRWQPRTRSGKAVVI